CAGGPGEGFVVSEPRRSARSSSRSFSCFLGGSLKTSFSRGFGLALSGGFGAVGFSGSTICFGFGGGGGGGGAGTASGGGAGAGAGAGFGAAAGAAGADGWTSSTAITRGSSWVRQLGENMRNPRAPTCTKA